MEGVTCHPLDEAGMVSVSRLLGVQPSEQFAAALCAVGQRLELGTELEPGTRHEVQLFALPPVQRVRVMVEVHPDLASGPLVSTEVIVPDDSPSASTIPDGGFVWRGKIVTPARLLVVVEAGEGVVAARLRRAVGTRTSP
jgi:hypothetical protein